MKYISIIYLFLSLTSLSLILCENFKNLFKECEQNILNDSLTLSCIDDSKISSIVINSSLLNDFKIKVKLKGIKSLQLMNSFDEINLKSLDLSNNFNSFDDFMTKINSFTKLESLNISHNKILILKDNQFNRLNNLNVLDLSYNELFYFELNAFKGLNILKYLNLSNNHFTEIEDFINLPNLEIINLDFNKINKIKSNTFTSLNNIVSVSLRFNNIKELNESAFKNLKNLENIILKGLYLMTKQLKYI